MSAVWSWAVIGLILLMGGAVGVAIYEYDALRRAGEEERP